MEGILSNQAIVVVTGHAKLLWWLERISPALVARLGEVYMKRLRRHRHPERTGG
jgi:hypothetical protein